MKKQIKKLNLMLAIFLPKLKKKLNELLLTTWYFFKVYHKQIALAIMLIPLKYTISAYSEMYSILEQLYIARSLSFDELPALPPTGEYITSYFEVTLEELEDLLEAHHNKRTSNFWIVKVMGLVVITLLAIGK